MRGLTLAGPLCRIGSAGDLTTDVGAPCEPTVFLTRRSSRGRPEAEDVPLEHPCSPFPVEGHRADPGRVQQPGLPGAEAPARGLPHLRAVQRPPSYLAGLTGPRHCGDHPWRVKARAANAPTAARCWPRSVSPSTASC